MVKLFRSSLCLIPAILLLALPVHSQIHPELKAVSESQIDSIFAEWNHPDTPGGAVAILKNNELVLAKGYGLADLEHNIPVTAETRFHISSVSKQFTAYAIALLAAEGILSLDEEIHKYLPELHDFGTPITIRNLIHHTAGFRQAMRLMAIAGTRFGELITQEKSKKLIWNHRELNFKPGTEHIYSNSHYILLATIVERVTGEPFSSWMHEHVFKPLGMTRTLIVDDYDLIVKDRAKPYRKTKEGYEQHMGLLWVQYGGTGIYTTVGDMAKWLAHLNQPDPKFAGVVRQMHKKGVLANGDTLSYAFGLDIATYRDRLTHIWHNGDGDGYRSYAGRLPEAGLGFVILTNVVPASPYSKAMEIADLYLSDWMEKHTENQAMNEDKEIVLDSLQLDRLTGDYLLTDHTIPYRREIFTISHRDGQLMIRGGGTAELIPTSDSTFRAIEGPVTFTFHRTSSGRVPAMTIHLTDKNLETQRVESSAYTLSVEKLKDYAGQYYSPELETEYRFLVKEDTLYARHEAYRDFILEPIMPDAFEAEFNFFKWVGFDRDESGKINGFRVTNSNDRVRNLWFKKVENNSPIK